MPSGDRTGPMGQGSQTGRKMGYCSGAKQAGFESAPIMGGGGAGGRGMGGGGAGGRGMGGGGAGGRGMGRRCRIPWSLEQEAIERAEEKERELASTRLSSGSKKTNLTVEEKMKIALTTSGEDLTSPFDAQFGRAPKFLVYDLESESFEVIDNTENLKAAHGAGIQAAQTIAQSGAGAVVTGHCGPKATAALASAGVKIFNTTAGTVQEALDLYRSGTLIQINSSGAGEA